MRRTICSLSLACLTLLIGIGAPASGQESEKAQAVEPAVVNPDPEKIVAEQMAFLDRELSLSEAQANLLRPILLDRAQKVNQYIGVKTDGDGSVKMRTEIYKLQREVEAKMAEILDEAQMQRFEELKQEEFTKRGRPPQKDEEKQVPPKPAT